MSTSRPSSTPALVREGLVIVASILVAFSIDAWWDARQEDQQASAWLDALAEDVVAGRAELERAVGLHEGIIAAADAVMRWAEDGADPATCGELRSSLAWLMAHPTFDPPAGTVETILGSGRADLIEDSDLLRELTRWSARVEDLQTEEMHANRHLTEFILPQMQGAMDLKNVVTTHSYAWPDGEGDPVPCDFIASRDFQSAVYRYWVWHVAAIRETVAPLEESMSTVLGLIEAQGAR